MSGRLGKKFFFFFHNTYHIIIIFFVVFLCYLLKLILTHVLTIYKKNRIRNDNQNVCGRNNMNTRHNVSVWTPRMRSSFCHFSYQNRIQNIKRKIISWLRTITSYLIVIMHASYLAKKEPSCGISVK